MKGDNVTTSLVESDLNQPCCLEKTFVFLVTVKERFHKLKGVLFTRQNMYTISEDAIESGLLQNRHNYTDKETNHVQDR